jgi:hypothetical protein
MQQPDGTTKGREGGQEEWGGGHDAFAMGRTMTKALFGDGSGRRQERGINTTISQIGMRSKDASDRGDTTGNDKPAGQKEKRAAQQ